MERTNVTVIFANIRTSKSTYYLLYDKPYSIFNFVTQLKKKRKMGGFSFKIGETRNMLKK